MERLATPRVVTREFWHAPCQTIRVADATLYAQVLQTHTAQYQPLWNCSGTITNTYSSVSAAMQLFCNGHKHIQLNISLYGTVLHRSQTHTAIGVRDGGQVGSWPPNSGRYMTFIRAKDNTFVWLTVSPRTEQVGLSIYLRYISGGLTKETFIGYSLRPSKTGTAMVHYYFFSLAGPRDKQVVFAIRAKLGLTPQMDVRLYAYAYSSVSASMELFSTGHRHIQLSISLYGTVLHRSQAHTAQYKPPWNCSATVTNTYSSISVSMELFCTDHKHIQLSISLYGTVLHRSQTHTAQYQPLWNCSPPVTDTYSSVSASMELFSADHRHIQLSISLYGTVLHRSQAHTAQYQPLWNCSPPVTGTYSSVSASMELFCTDHKTHTAQYQPLWNCSPPVTGTYSSVSASMKLFSTGHRHIQLSISLYGTVLHRSQTTYSSVSASMELFCTGQKTQTAQYQPLWNCSAPVKKHKQLSISLYETVLHRSQFHEQLCIAVSVFAFHEELCMAVTIFALQQLPEKWTQIYTSCSFFVDLEKVYDRIPSELISWCLRKTGLLEEYDKIVQDNCTGKEKHMELHRKVKLNISKDICRRSGTVCLPLSC